MPHDGHDQPGIGLRRDTHVYGIEARHDALLVVEARIHLRKRLHGKHDRPHQERQDSEPAPSRSETLVELRAQGFELGDVDLLDIGKVRDAQAGLHVQRDFPAQPDHGNRVLTVTLGIALRERGLRGAAGRMPHDVGMHDMPFRSRPAHL